MQLRQVNIWREEQAGREPGGEMRVGDVRALLPVDINDESISTEVQIYEDKLVAPIEAGTVLGEVHIVADGKDYGSIKLVNPNAVELSKSEYIKTQLKAFFSKGWVITLIIVILSLLAVYLILVARYRALRRRHLEERRRAEAQRRRQREERERERARRLAEEQYEQQYGGEEYDSDDGYGGYDGYDPYSDRYYVDDDDDEPHTDPADIDELFRHYDKFN